jgi:phosphatidylinositol glycan class O
MGDDTWGSLYPDELHRSYLYDSFNVRDLYTVDNGVHEHLLPEIASMI